LYTGPPEMEYTKKVTVKRGPLDQCYGIGDLGTVRQGGSPGRRKKAGKSHSGDILCLIKSAKEKEEEVNTNDTIPPADTGTGRYHHIFSSLGGDFPRGQHRWQQLKFFSK